MKISKICFKKVHLFLCFTPLFISLISCENVIQTTEGSKDPEAVSIDSTSEEKNKVNENDNHIVGSSDSDSERDLEVNPPVAKTDKDNSNEFSQPLFVDSVSQNSGLANDVVSTGQPVVVTLTNSPATELHERANIPSILPSQLETSELKNNNSSDVTVDSSSHDIEDNATEHISQDLKPVLETVTTENIVMTVPSNKDNDSSADDKTEEIPSFSEWAQKRLEEAEKNNEQAVNLTNRNPNLNGKSGSGAKLRWKNYASLDCGAKVVAANPEAGNPSAILSPSRDEYKLNTCTSRIWFIVELCEAIQAQKIDLANFELFSSAPKDLTVSISDRFPTREWSVVGQFTAKDERDIQSFDLNPHLFGKYIKVEIKSHYGSEHFCPISLFRVYGTSEFEVLQKEDPVHSEQLDDEDDDDDLDVANGESPKNLFSSATDAVISMVKKAAEVLGKSNLTNQTTTEIETKKETRNTPIISTCTTPSHLIVCNNCSDVLFGQVYELLSCKAEYINKLVGIPFISKSLYNSLICNEFGFNFKGKNNDSTLNSGYLTVQSFFPSRFLGAMCNTVAVMDNKVVLNISQQYPNITKTATSDDQIVNIETSEPHVIKADELTETAKETKTEEMTPTDDLKFDIAGIEIVKTSCSTDISYTSQIKPTKSFPSQIDLDDTANIQPLEIKDSPEIDSGETQSVETDNLPEATQETPPNTEGIINQMDNSAEKEQVTESPETLEDHLDHLISDLTDHGQKDIGQAQPSAHTPQVQKESVFLRLSNRIKALERNMSLSSQYLEELSKRYKKQVEEMQRLLDKTIITLNEESRKKEERNRQLEERLNVLTAAVESLIAEKNSWHYRVQWIFLSCIVAFGVFTFCGRSSRHKRPSDDRKENPEVQRRQSIDVVTHSTPKKNRRPSDQALKIVRSAMLASDNDDSERRSRERKKKKKKYVRRSSSINTLSEETVSTPELRHQILKVWNRQESAPANTSNWVEGVHNKIHEIPFVLDESEHSTLEDLPISVDNVDAPSFLKTAANSRQGRLSVQNGSLKINGDTLKPEVRRKGTSLDETEKRSRKSPVPSLNGASSVASSSDQDQKTPKKDKKSFRKLFRKVF